ncbi:MAG: response regulator transcription factor [Spirochaetales bacterium]|nr:response regulator transcription factor [Spirochaetales bacterium]
MNRKIIFAIEDDSDILSLLETTFTKEHYIFEGFGSAKDFFERLKFKIPDLIILDLMLPDIDGFEIIKRLKTSKDYNYIPLIIVSAKTDEIDKVVGLEIGADDYIVKPFSVKELLVRVKKQIQKEKSFKHEEIEKDELVLELPEGNLKLSKVRHSVFFDNEKLNLTSAEFKILEKLMENPGWIISRDKLLDYLWGNEKAVIDRTIDVHVTHLRQKLKKAGKYIKNERGIGYKFDI